jgi:pimeloyl-ACP methyl ester carboxylesterase
MAEGELRSRYVMAGGVKTHYTEAGNDGPVIVALHGGGAGASGAAGMSRMMTRLGRDFRIIALDSIGGFGKTDPYAPSPYGLQSRVDHLVAFADALCLETFTVAGNSQGAWVAAKYAMVHPDRVERLVLIASNTIAQAMGLEVKMNPARAEIFSFDGTREGMRRLLEALVHDRTTVTEALIDMRMQAVSRPGALESFRAAMKANSQLQSHPLMSLNFDMRHTLPTLTKLIPTIMLWGENDQSAPPEVGRRVEPLLPDVKFHWFERAGHQVQTDHPEEVARIVTEFMQSGGRK